MAVPSELKVTFTEFETAETNEGNVVTVPWNDFAELVMEQGFFEASVGKGSEQEYAAAKKSLPLIIPAEFAEGTNRKKQENVERVWMGALDFDELDSAQFKDVVDRIVGEGLEAILYTTWGHPQADPLFKFRVLVPFSRPVRKREWPLFWQMFHNLLGGLGDKSCKDSSRGYFAPGVPKGTADEHKVLHRFIGDALDVNKLLSGVDTLSTSDLSDIQDVGKEHIDRDRVKRFARKLVASKHEYVAWMGVRISKMLKGEPYAEKGERDNTTYKMARDLGKEFSNGDADSLASLFAQSLSNMGSDGPTVEDVREKIQRAQSEESARKVKEEKSKLAVEQSFLETSGAPSDYDKKFVGDFCSFTGNGCNFDLFRQRLIVQRGNSYYVFSVNTYWPYSKEELPNACRDLFKPAEGSLGASIYNVSDKGLETPKPAQQLVHDYGVVAKKEEIRIWANASYYEESTQTMVVAPYAKRKLVPQKHEEVDRWIDQLCGTDELREAFRNWLAVAPDTTRPLAMLVFIGKTGVGKTSFADGLSRLWTLENATRMQSLFETNFNTGLKNSPVLLADECFPKDFRGRVLTEKIRSFISAGQHQVNDKNKSLVPLKGYFRTVAALNDKHHMDFGGRHSKEDIEAIQARTLLIPVQPRAFFDFDLFVNQNAIAEHALYLQEKIEVAESRFGIGIESNLADFVHDTFSEEVFDWVIWFLENRKLEDEKSLPAFVTKGDIFVSTDGLAKFWTACHTDKKELGRRAAGQVLKIISNGRLPATSPMGVRRNYYRISKEMLRSYATRENYDVEILMLRLMLFTKQIIESPYVRISKQYLPSADDAVAAREAETRIKQLIEEDEGNLVEEA